MIIDAHHHLWTADYAWLADPSLAPIRRDYTVADLRGHLRAAGVDRTVLVEAGRGDDAVLVIVTHGAPDAALAATVTELRTLDIVRSVASVLRVEGEQ